MAARDVPHDETAAAEWLLGWWRRIDAWILENHGRQALPDAAVRAVLDKLERSDRPEEERPRQG